MNYIRVRKVLGAPGKGHKYIVQPYVVIVATGEVKKHPTLSVSISGMSVRMGDNDSKWQIQEDGTGCSWRILTAERVAEINDPALTALFNTNETEDAHQEKAC